MPKYKRNGRFIELYFDNIPDSRIRESLKVCGWRWFHKNQCWSNIWTDENEQLARTICSQDIGPGEGHSCNYDIDITVDKLVLRSNSFYCNSHHKVTDMTGVFTICNKFGDYRRYLAPVAYCDSCGLFFILDNTFDELKKHGVPLCQIMKYPDYQRYQNNPWLGELRPEGIMKMYGYSVGQKEGLTDEQRRSILENLIDKRIMTKDRVLSYLDLFLKMHEDKEGYYSYIGKWKDDRAYVNNYRLGSSRRVMIEEINPLL